MRGEKGLGLDTTFRGERAVILENSASQTTKADAMLSDEPFLPRFCLVVETLQLVQSHTRLLPSSNTSDCCVAVKILRELTFYSQEEAGLSST